MLSRYRRKLKLIKLVNKHRCHKCLWVHQFYNINVFVESPSRGANHFPCVTSAQMCVNAWQAQKDAPGCYINKKLNSIDSLLFRRWTGQVWMCATGEGYWNDRSSIPDNRSGLTKPTCEDWLPLLVGVTEAPFNCWQQTGNTHNGSPLLTSYIKHFMQQAWSIFCHFQDQESQQENSRETENKDWISMMDSLVVWINKANRKLKVNGKVIASIMHKSPLLSWSEFSYMW